jgi:hypothetical protein
MVDSDQNAEISNIKVRLTTVETQKANVSELSQGLSLKADINTVNFQLEQKASTIYVDGKLAEKAATTYVDEQLSTKATSAEHQVLVNEVAARKSAENAWITAVKDAIYIESTPGSGTEFDYTPLGISS